jgi:uncharacterized metal-binding protein
MKNKDMPKSKPLVYSCSGCSSAAQMANALAVRADRAGLAEMSCIAGVGGDVAPLVKTAKSGRDIIVLDGCSLECAKACLARHDVKPTVHMKLSDFKVKKIQHGDYDPAQAELLYQKLKGVLDR